MTTFISNVPLWVVPLFIVLLILGLRASKTRRVPIYVLYALPLLGILTLRNIAALSPPSWIWILAALFYLVGFFFGMSWQRKWLVARGVHFVRLKGEWITLMAMMIIFIAGFVKGFLSDVAPNVAHSIGFAAVFAAVTCLPAGQFLGRVITTLRAPITDTL